MRPKLWTVFATLLATGGALAAPYDASPFGINGIKYEWVCKSPIGWARAKTPARVMKNAGIFWDRDPIPWGVVEPAKDAWDWSCPDGAARFNEEQGINSIILLSGCSAWSNNTPPTTDSERAAYAEYVYRMVSRYKDRFKVWEIWNEPNIPFFWPQPNVKDYTLLLRDAYAAAKRADPTCTVLAANTSGPDLTFIRGIHQHGGWDSFDGLCIHPYSMAGGPIPQKFDRILRMINDFVRSTGKPKSLWITEMGWVAKTPEEERNQAIWLFQSHIIALANGVEKLCWFDLDDWEERWGIVRTSNPFRPKVAYGTYRLMTQALGSPGRCAQFEGWLPTAPDTACYVFSTGGAEKVLALWSSDGLARIVDLGQRSGLRAVDVFGSNVAVNCGRISVGEAPVLVFGARAREIARVTRANPYQERRGDSLVVNGPMDIVHGSSPAYWNPGRFDGTAKDAVFATIDGGHGGSKCVSVAGSDERAAYDSAPIPVYPGRRYRLTAWAKTQDASGENQVGIFWYKGNMWTYIGEARSESVSGTSGWRKLGLTATAPEDAMFARVNLISCGNTGSVLFDDVTLVEE